MDVEYVDSWSLWLDLKLLSISLIKVVRRDGISQPGHVSAEFFRGNQSHAGSEDRCA